MTVVTNKYRTSNAEFFVEDFTNSNYYIFASSTVSSNTVNTNFSINEFLEKTIFGKKINSADVKFLIDNNRWSVGSVFDQYDDQIDVSGKKFYAVVYPADNTSGDYRVYKCLFNNYGTPVQTAPNFDADVDDQIYRMGDGYVWKFMYAISVPDFEKYSTLNFLPIIGESSSNTIFGSTIDTIEVTNFDTNKGYELVTGVIEEVLDTDITIYSSRLNLSAVTGYYAQQNLYVTSPDNISRVYTIESYTFNSETLRATIRLVDKDSFIQENFNFEIFPRIEIIGDGEGAVAIPKINTLGTIERILVLNKGHSYTNARARVVRPLFGFDPNAANSVDVEAILRPILSPPGGHGSNFARELRSTRVLIHTEITDADNLTIPTSNTYTKIGLVKNPTFTEATTVFDNRIEIEVDNNILAVGEIVTQSLSGVTTFSAEVHAVNGNLAYLCNYHGPYQNYSVGGYTDIALDLGRPIISAQNQIFNINNTVRPKYVQKTGDVYYMTSFAPITRTNSSNEEYKIILEF